jgi:hypothetical protein
MLCVASHCSPISFKLFSGLNRNFEYLVVRWCVVKHVMRYCYRPPVYVKLEDLCHMAFCNPKKFTLVSNCHRVKFQSRFSGLNRNFEYLVVRWCVVKHVMRYKTFCPQGVVCQDKVVSSNVVWFIYMKSWNHFHKTRLSGLLATQSIFFFFCELLTNDS